MLRNVQADPGRYDVAAELSTLAARWQGRWPGPTAPSAAACLTVAGTREALLEALALQLGKPQDGTWQARCTPANLQGAMCGHNDESVPYYLVCHQLQGFFMRLDTSLLHDVFNACLLLGPRIQDVQQ